VLLASVPALLASDRSDAGVDTVPVAAGMREPIAGESAAGGYSRPLGLNIS
jgi:hypothetical protein